MNDLAWLGRTKLLVGEEKLLKLNKSNVEDVKKQHNVQNL
jgi:hypothetical protein